ncbi:hypothetical protein SCL_1791 [Sulfuricaulis limicola]|uniref:Lcl C-terminal domain-containing protein n=1 Tax=Sulfuricaulis limicola TaxID=1620215 RepID=A0A1B4XH33_9GAMM|nr:DUF1566 domain-containing protein [Sulfuricaulis limicola]BAV34089.1 hypothetical protein SCL_1791 [Sulfuricaulis limicola]
MRNLHLILVLATCLLPLTTAQAAPADLPKTGQTTCTDTAGAVIDCAGTGQDGEHQAGVAWPTTRFSVDGTGNCVTDNLTGLMWVRSPDATVRTWQQALDFANNLDLCGAADWRLPNVNELESLVNSEAADQASFLNIQGFSGVQAGSYWSSSIYAALGPAYAWIVGMSDGYVNADDKIRSSYVWPARGGR